MELLKNRHLFREQVVAARDNEGDVQDAEVPKTVEDVDRVNLGNVVIAAQSKLFNKLVKQFEEQSALKMRKINKNQCRLLHMLLCSRSYCKAGQ